MKGRNIDCLLEEEMASSQKKREMEVELKIQEITRKGYTLETREVEELYKGCSRVAAFKKGKGVYFLLHFPGSFLLCCDYYYSKYKDDGRYPEMSHGGKKNER